jgi:PLD-like domain
MLTESPCDPLHRRLQRLRYLHHCFDCYRAEPTSSRAGLPLAVDQRLCTAHFRFKVNQIWCILGHESKSRPRCERYPEASNGWKQAFSTDVPVETMRGSRATASVKASTECDPREWSNRQARKPVPARLVVYLILGLLVFCPPYALAAEITVCFTPEYGMTPSCTQEVVDALTGAKKNVLVQAYSFTSAPIAKALVDAHRRGVDVKVILDRSNRTAHYSAATFLAHAGIPVWIDDRHANGHE